MIKHLALLSLCVATLNANDSDMDGVPDHLDRCANTPFFNQVDAHGCTSATLTLPQDSANGLYLTLGYGVNHNEDLKEDEERQFSTALEVNYYHNNWNYALILGYFHSESDDDTEDVQLKIKRTFEVTNKLKVSLGGGVKLPTYGFEGNEADYQLQSSFVYYHTSAFSIFGGVGYEWINDEDDENEVQNIASLYLGSGYFFSDDLYANLSYSYKQSKFASQHDIHLLQSTIFYKLNENYFATLSYGHQILDHDLHNSLNINIGYSFW
ncbi:MAG: hypothetical protein U9N49_04415 [Campylobacterota bacterium]|nr:hypothetical protein [Campylobacterota bacterium]